MTQELFATSSPDPAEHFRLEAQCKSGAHWFYWIAVLSLITSLIALSGSQWGFIVSLGITQIVDALANQAAENAGTAAKVIAFVFDLMAVGAFALVGYFASKKHAWVFVAGMVFYALDGLIFLLAQDWLAIAFHAFALYGMFSGYRACRKLLELQQESADASVANASVAAAPVASSPAPANAPFGTTTTL
jgi:hypothetical protein